MNIKIGTLNISVKNVAKALIFLFVSITITILLYHFIVKGVDWVDFVEFMVSCLLLIFLVEKVNITIPGLFEIKNELGEIRKNLSVVAQNISNVKVSTKITNVTPTYYEGPPLDIDAASSTLSTATSENLFDKDEEKDEDI